MRLIINADSSDRADILSALNKARRMIESGESHTGAMRDENGNKIGKWLLVEWDNIHSILDYAEHHGLTLRHTDIVVEDGDTLIDNMDAEAWFDYILSDD